MAVTSNILLVGGGGLGVIAALSLEASCRAQVTAVLRSNYKIVKENGYNVKSCDHGDIEGWSPTKIVRQIPQVSSDDQPYDYIVITTKNIPSAGPGMAELIAPAVSPRITVIVLIQNGLNIEKSYLERYPYNIILSGISFAGSQELQPGVIEHGNHDHLLVGAFWNENVDIAREQAAAKSFVSLYAASGKASCFYTANTMSHRWKKLVYNAIMNPLCAITNLDSGSLRQSGSAMLKTIRDAMEEIIAAAGAAGYTLPPGTAEDLLKDDPIDGHFEPSMLRDVRKVCQSAEGFSTP
ncbi:related to ketopantoate reductase [Fusarium oxysporum]|uniref:Related to ketopantoate reductase n=1 Tax=Fusarium oxysporum TaxID=5507 RepID=A0A2H3U765_FUSOX|nr:related to ketopantoate reductase [Fusarium oxysporum]